MKCLIVIFDIKCVYIFFSDKMLFGNFARLPSLNSASIGLKTELKKYLFVKVHL